MERTAKIYDSEQENTSGLHYQFQTSGGIPPEVKPNLVAMA